MPTEELLASMNNTIQQTLILAKSVKCDVFNALNLMHNDVENVLKPLRFGAGDGFLQYYLYNWRCPSIEPSDVGLVLF